MLVGMLAMWRIALSKISGTGAWRHVLELGRVWSGYVVEQSIARALKRYAVQSFCSIEVTPHFLEKDGIVLQRIQVRRIAPQRQLVQSLRAVVVTLHVLKKLRVC
jgi:hypothetical protein